MVLLRRFIHLVVFGVATRFGAASTIAKPITDPIHVFAVGFDLTDTYGTASIRLAGGEVRLAARVDGDEQWVELMQRLGRESSRHMSPPYEWWHDGGAVVGLGDLPRQTLRRARKAIGLPASGDVGTISNMLSALREQAEQKLTGFLEAGGAGAASIHHTRISIDRIVLTSPELPALYDEDIYDAALHSRIELLQSPQNGYHMVPDPDRNITWELSSWIARQPKHSHALFAAHGLAGNLHHPISPSADPALKKHNFLLVHLTRHGLELVPQIKLTNRSCDLSWGQHMGWYNGSLAWPSSLPDAEWRRGVLVMLRSATEGELRNHYFNIGDMNVTDVLFAGESGALPALRDIVVDYIQHLPGQSVEPQLWPRIDADDKQDWVENGGSYGAAMMAWQLVAEAPLEGDVSECSAENRRNMNHASSIHYSIGSAMAEYSKGGPASFSPQQLVEEL